MSKTLSGIAGALALGVIAVLGTAPDIAADEANNSDPARVFDKAMMSIFFRGQDTLTATTRPIMLIARDVTVITEAGERTYPRKGPLYDKLKSVSHVLLGIIGAVTPWPEGEAGEARWKADFTKIRAEIDTFLEAIDGIGLSAKTLASQRAMLMTARGFIDDALARGALSPEDVAGVINEMRPVWVANMRDSARTELTALDAAVTAARADLDDDEWEDLYIVSHGGASVRAVNVVRLYLQRVMPEKFNAGQVLFAENRHGKDDMIRYVGYVRMQRHVGAWAFGDPGRMEVDLLGYEAGAILDEMIETTPPIATGQ